MSNKSDKGRPEAGKIYSLTGGPNTPSIARGDSWKDSEVIHLKGDFVVCELCGKFSAKPNAAGRGYCAECDHTNSDDFCQTCGFGEARYCDSCKKTVSIKKAARKSILGGLNECGKFFLFGDAATA